MSFQRLTGNLYDVTRVGEDEWQVTMKLANGKERYCGRFSTERLLAGFEITASQIMNYKQIEMTDRKRL